MYTSRGFREWEMGDIDVIRRGKEYHLFHLVLPNHDYIAHAVSLDGMTWTRTRNALFTGEPGTWDDDMLWTMHVSRNPVRKVYEMFFTGLHRAENGHIQRIGRAVSRDLLHWKKENDQGLPLAPQGLIYESAGKGERGWISFRDPFLFRNEGNDWLLICARVVQGIASRRGCVGLVQRSADGYALVEPLFFPRMYDDIECPCMAELDGWFYLIGSVREDVEVHYWWSNSFRGEYQSFRHNVLLPRGNYAARVMVDGGRALVFNVFIDGLDVESGVRSIPPPKELRKSLHGGLELVTYHRWEEKKLGTRPLSREAFASHLANPKASCTGTAESLTFCSTNGYEIFTVPEDDGAYLWSGRIRVRQQGQCGFVFGLDDHLGGYFISLDAVRGVAQIRAWGSRPERVFRNYIYEDLQLGTFPPSTDGSYLFSLLRWGSYIELSIDGVVRLTLVDGQFNGRNLGIFVESAEVELASQTLFALAPPSADGSSPPARKSTSLPGGSAFGGDTV